MKKTKKKPYEFDSISLCDFECDVLTTVDTLYNYADEAIKAGYKEVRLELGDEESQNLDGETRSNKFFRVMFY